MSFLTAVRESHFEVAPSLTHYPAATDNANKTTAPENIPFSWLIRQSMVLYQTLGEKGYEIGKLNHKPTKDEPQVVAIRRGDTARILANGMFATHLSER